MKENDFFHVDDPKITELAGFKLPRGWWSRGYEYPWALQFVPLGGVVLDAGTGYTYRPFRYALAEKAKRVVCIDVKEPEDLGGFLPNMDFMQIDMTADEYDFSNYYDRVFCISVLEDVGEKVPMSLAYFYERLRPGGLAVLTFDVQYEMDKPLGKYPGVDYLPFVRTVKDVGFKFREKNYWGSKVNAVFNPELNLSCCHMVLQK